MKTLSIWAIDHPRISQVIIALSHLALLGLLLMVGFLMYMYDIAIPVWLTWVFALIYFTTFIVYPSSKREYHWWKSHFWKLRALHFTIVLSAFMTILLAFAQFASDPMSQTQFSPEPTFIVHNELQTTTSKNKISLGKRIKKTVAKVKRSLNQLKQKYSRQLSEKSVAMKIILTLLLAILIIALLYVIAFLSCGLSCSGSPALALILLLTGTGGLIFLGIFGFRRIFRSNKEKAEPKTT